MTKILIFIIKIYQYLISPLLGSRCRFLPTCSEYFIEALKTRGLTIGIKLGLKRILTKNTKLQSDFVWVYLEDLLPDQMIEYGEVLPKSGQEKKWFNSLSPSLRKRLKKMEKSK